MLALRAASARAAFSVAYQRQSASAARCLDTAAAVRCVSCMSAVTQQSNKRAMVRIGTHSGTFHCDEALGCFLLKQMPQFKDADVVRTRDPKVLQGLDIVIDVGATYDPEAQRFDHHQRGFEEVFGHGFSTKLSSAGLVYKHFGRDIVAAQLGQPAESPDVETVYLAVYKHFMEAIDGIDNGISQWDASGKPSRYLSSTHLSARVGGLNPRWNQDAGDEAADAQFAKAMALTGAEFLDCVDYITHAWLPARSLVKDAVGRRHDVDGSGEIIELAASGVPWKEHLYELEKQEGIDGAIKFCLYEDTREKKWRVQAVSVQPGSFENRRSLPAAWRGLRDEELSGAAGIPGCVFVHASGFIGGAATRDGALEMARRALKED